MKRIKRRQAPKPTVIQKHRAWHGLNPFGKKFDHLNIQEQATVLTQVFGKDHRRGKKRIVTSTSLARARLLTGFIDLLHKEGYRIKSLTNLSEKHIEVAVATWRGQGRAEATIATRLSMLRWLTEALGKPGLVRLPRHYGLTIGASPRDTAAAQGALWTSKGTVPEAKIAEIRSCDPWAGTQLALIHHFGLTVTEALLLKPDTAHQGSELVINRGKGRGPARRVAIKTAQHVQTLEAARTLARESERHSMVQPGKSPRQAQRRLYYICAKFGVTRDQLDITLRGLRLERVLADAGLQVEAGPDSSDD